MTNSQTYGPSQVQDLSEPWGEDAQKTKVFTALVRGLPEAHVYPTTPAAESHPSASTVFQSHSTLHRANSPCPRALNGSLASHTAGIGARFSRVKGSTPSTVTYGVEYRPAYLTHVLRRLNTVAAKKQCGT